MNTDKILELAHSCISSYKGDHTFECTSGDLVYFAASVINAERESSDEPVAYLWKSHFIDTGKPIKLWLDEPTWPMGIGSDIPIVPVYTRPAPARKPLTDEQISQLASGLSDAYGYHLTTETIIRKTQALLLGERV